MPNRRHRDHVCRVLGLDPVTLLPAASDPAPVDLQDADIAMSMNQRAYLSVFDERLKQWRTWDRDRELQARYRAAFRLMMAGAYPLEDAA